MAGWWRNGLAENHDPPICEVAEGVAASPRVLGVLEEVLEVLEVPEV